MLFTWNISVWVLGAGLPSGWTHGWMIPAIIKKELSDRTRNGGRKQRVARYKVACDYWVCVLTIHVEV